MLDAEVFLVTKDKTIGYSHLEATAKQIKVTNIITNEVNVFKRQTDVYSAFNISPKTVIKYLNNGQSYKNMTFEYYDSE